MKRGVICQMCGVEAPSQYVEFYQNIGALVVRYHKSVRGNLCKRCIHKSFWKLTLTDLTLGWWGTMSVIVTPIYIINNTARYLAALGLPATPPDAAPPQLTNEAAAKLANYGDELVKRLNNKEPIADVATSIARTAGVTPGQVVLYVRALSTPRPQAAPAQAGPVPLQAKPAMPSSKPPIAVPVPPPAIPSPSAPVAPPPDLLDGI